MSRAADHKNEPEISFEHLDTLAIAGSDRTLTLPVEGGPREFPIPGDMSIPTMARLLLVERKLDDAATGDLESAFTEAVAEIMRIVRVRTPDAPAPDPDEFGVKRIAGTLAWIAGDVSVADAFRVTLTAGAPPPAPGDPVATAHAASDEVGDEVHGDNPGPLASTTLSETPSSSLDASIDGGPSGGDTAPGGDSVSTSLTPASV